MKFQNETQILYSALAEPIGLVLEVSDITLARANLYSARREAQDPDLSGLQFRRTVRENELWIVKGKLKEPKINE